MSRSSRESARNLFGIALGQGGYFTAKQAQEAGYSYPHLEYHVSTDAFERIEHGLYRLKSIPPVEHDELIRVSLWSRNRKDEPQAIVSHETALVLHGLSELLPRQLHFSVPPKFRKSAPPGCVLHKTLLNDNEVEEREGFQVTKPLRTLLDVAEYGISREQVEKAVEDAIAKGLIRRSQSKAILQKAPVARPKKR